MGKLYQIANAPLIPHEDFPSRQILAAPLGQIGKEDGFRWRIGTVPARLKICKALFQLTSEKKDSGSVVSLRIIGPVLQGFVEACERFADLIEFLQCNAEAGQCLGIAGSKTQRFAIGCDGCRMTI